MASAETTHRDLCMGCRGYKEIVYTEGGTGRDFCADCMQLLPPSNEQLALLLLTHPDSPYSSPFRPGDRVEVRTGGQIYDGVGVIKEVSMSLLHGGTPINPTFLVELDERAHDLAPESAYYTEVCMTKTTEGDDA